MYLLESIETWESFMIEPLEARIMLTVIPGIYGLDNTAVHDAGNGSVLVTSETTDDAAVMILKFGPDGSADKHFGGDGMVFIGGAGYIDNLRTQPDGKILVLTGGYQPWATLYRLNANGEPDLSFGKGGRVTLGNQLEWSGKIILHEDGRITIVQIHAGSNVAVWRLTADGKLDPTFGGGQPVRLQAPAPIVNVAQASLGERGELNLALTSQGSSGGFVRLGADGTIEKSAAAGDNRDYLDWNILPDDRILSIEEDEIDQDLLILRRYDAQGTPDPSFGDGGVSRIVRNDWSFVTQPSTQLPDGRTAIGFFTRNSGTELLVIDRQGAPDAAFGDGGWLVTDEVSDPNRFLTRWMDFSVTAQGDILEMHRRDAMVPSPALGTDQLVIQLIGPGGQLIGAFGTGGRITLDIDPALAPTFDQIDAPTAIPDEANPAAPDPTPPGDAEMPLRTDPAIVPAPTLAAPVFPLDSAPGQDRARLFAMIPQRSLLGQLEDDLLLL